MDTLDLYVDRYLRRPAVGLVVCCAVTAAIYAPHVLNAPFVYEDLNDINTTYRPWEGIAAEAHAVLVQPARALSRAVDRLVGFDPVRQHAASLGLHLTAGLLVYALALEILTPWSAVLAAAFLLLAPWQVEAVAYAAARPDLLLTIAVLAGALAITRDRFGLAWLCAVAAVPAKESGVAAWLLLPAWALWIGVPWPLPWLAVWIGSGATAGLVALATHGGTLTWPPVLSGLRDLAGLLTTPPWGLTIESSTATWAPLAVLAAGAVVGMRFAPRWTALVAGGVLLAWLPRLLVPLAEGPHVHHLYLPMVALSLGAARLFTSKGQ